MSDSEEEFEAQPSKRLKSAVDSEKNDTSVQRCQQRQLTQPRITDLFSKAGETVTKALQDNPDVTEAKATVKKGDETLTVSLKRTLDQAASSSSAQPNTNQDNMMTWAVIYEWVFDNIDYIEHPLFEISYIGQVVRTGVTAEQAFYARTNEHECASYTDPKENGIRYMIKAYGKTAFTIRILEKAYLNKLEAMEWADEREKYYINLRGGKLKDMENKLNQTLNLTSGGQGDPKQRWENIQARSSKGWNKFKKFFQMYYDREGNGNVSFNHIEYGYNLGWSVNCIRSNKTFIKMDESRIDWLQQRGWVEDALEAKWKRFQHYYQMYYDREQHGLVPAAHLEYTYPLGRVVAAIRSLGNYIRNRPDRLEWLQRRGWVENTNEVAWNLFQRHYQSFYDRENHDRIPYGHIENGYKLHMVADGIRHNENYIIGHPERVEWLKARGWKFTGLVDGRWEDFQTHYQSFYDREKHGNVPGGHIENGFHLGHMVKYIRNGCCFVKNHPERLEWLKLRGWIDNVYDLAWEQYKAAFETFVTRKGHGQVPQKHIEDGYLLGRNTNNIRSNFQFIKGHPDRIQWLQDHKFVMNTKDSNVNASKWKSVRETCS